MEAAAAGAPDAAALATAAMCDGLHAPADVQACGTGRRGRGRGRGRGSARVCAPAAGAVGGGGGGPG